MVVSEGYSHAELSMLFCDDANDKEQWLTEGFFEQLNSCPSLQRNCSLLDPMGSASSMGFGDGGILQTYSGEDSLPQFAGSGANQQGACQIPDLQRLDSSSHVTALLGDASSDATLDFKTAKCQTLPWQAPEEINTRIAPTFDVESHGCSNQQTSFDTSIKHIPHRQPSNEDQHQEQNSATCSGSLSHKIKTSYHTASQFWADPQVSTSEVLSRQSQHNKQFGSKVISPPEQDGGMGMQQNSHKGTNQNFREHSALSTSDGKTSNVNGVAFLSTTNCNEVEFAPLRPLSAYNYFFRTERDRLLSGKEKGETCKQQRQALLMGHWKQDRTKKRAHRKTHGKISFSELSKLISGRWKSLDEHERDFYKETAAIDMQRYKSEMEHFSPRN